MNATNGFPLPDAAFNVLHAVKVEDTRKFIFDQPVQVRRGTFEQVSLFAPSKREAKHDKVTLRNARSKGTRPYRVPDYAARNAGLVGTLY